MARAPYFVQLEEIIKRKAVLRTPGFNLLAVRELVELIVRWKVKKKGVWQEQEENIVLKPGIVLHLRWRILNKAEMELSDEELKKLKVFQKKRKKEVLIVEQIKDLPAAIRRALRHIPAALIGQERKGFRLSGDANQLEAFVIGLNKLMQRYLLTPKPSSALKEKASKVLSQSSSALENSKDLCKRLALAEIDLARKAKSALEVPGRLAQATTNLLVRRLLDYELAFRSIENAEKWFSLMVQIENLFQKSYNRLGHLGQEIEMALKRNGSSLTPHFLEIAKEVCGIYTEMNRKVYFNPYYQRIQAPEFQRLRNVLNHAKAGKPDTVLRTIKGAVSKLEAVAIGEKPTLVELQKAKEEGEVLNV